MDGEKLNVVEKELPGGIKIIDFKVGTGPAAKKGNTVGMRYIGKLQNGKVFDSNKKGKPVRISLSLVSGFFLNPTSLSLTSAKVKLSKVFFFYKLLDK